MPVQTTPHPFEAAIRRVASRLGKAKLSYGHGTFNAGEEAVSIVLHACGIPHEAYEARSGYRPTPAEMRRIDSLTERRIQERVPVAYLTHEAWLRDFRFYVDRRVIVPRSFIAELLPDDIALLLQRPVRSALDLCTGSGCLAVLLAHAFPRAKVDAVDLSAAALAVAGRNVAAYRMTRRIRVVRSNLFESIPQRRYDLIVSNPPYVDATAMAALPDEYRAEPRMALAGGKDGLWLVRKILAGARARLHPRGTLICEIGHNRKALERAYPRVPFTWLETSAGDGFLFLLEKEQLPA